MSSVQVRVTTFEYQSPNFAYYELFADETHLATNAVENYAAFKLVFFADYAIHANLQFGDTWHYWIRAVYDNGATEGPLFYLGSITISGTSDGTDDQTAAEVPYDDTTTALGAGNVQEAIEALAAGVSEGVGGGGDLDRITETITTGSATHITFSSISSDGRDLEIYVRARGDTAANSTVLVIQLNGDTGANYEWTAFNNFGTASDGAATGWRAGQLTAASSTANYWSGIKITIFDYKDATPYKSFQSETIFKEGATMSYEFARGYWRSTAAITSVKVFPTAGAYVNGSVGSLYIRH